MTDLAGAESLRRHLGPPMEGHPLLERIERAFGLGAGIGDTPVRELMRRIVREYIPDRLNFMLHYLHDNPGMEVAGVNLRTYVLFSGSHCSINLSLIDSVSPTLHWHPHDALLYRVNPGTSRVHYYRLPDGLANEAVDRTAQLEFAGTSDFSHQSFLTKRAPTDILDFEATPDAPLVVARLHLPSQGPLDWSFDRRSLKPLGATGNDPAESNLISLIRAAALFPQADLELLRGAVRHHSHAVRWAAVQAIGRRDADAAAALLPELTRDPHPHIRRAAERTLASLPSPGID